MKEKINQLLSQLAAEQGITILLAVESGSRAWGFASPDSDFDVRFIYLRTLEYYLSVYSGEDNIDLPEKNDLDLVGWDLKKALFLLGKSNCTLLDWIGSPIVYQSEKYFHSEIEELALSMFQPITGIYHYLNLAKKTGVSTNSGLGASLKRQLYCLRSLMACHWIYQSKTPPPVPFRLLVDFCPYSKVEKQVIIDLVEKKKRSVESTDNPLHPVLANLVAREFDLHQHRVKSLPSKPGPNTSDIDTFFQKWVLNE
ncbi:MAG: nucleotidyltransferase domain-containing protein [Saprospirales bacterium]|nr:MAG: nucleotidyltransferase domain-containing protein [Saprospirales bacterium]